MDASATPWKDRAILHVDMDAFFASVEQLDHPQLRGLPVVVGREEERGVVAAASYEARRYGVRSAMPSAQARRLCPQAIWAPPRFGRYKELSNAACALFSTFTPHVERVSIDEAYLDVTPSRHRPVHPATVAEQLQERVDDLGLSCSVGVATSKTVAKIASDRDKPHGITVVQPGTEAAFLAPLPVQAMPGIGSATAETLREAGIRTLGDLASLDAASAKGLLGRSGPLLAARACGIDDRPVAQNQDVKSVSNERTFSTDVRDRAQIERELRGLVDTVSSRLRTKGLRGRTLTVKLRHADFTTRTVSRTLEEPVDLASDMLPVALALLDSAWAAGTGLRLLGFGVSGFGHPCVQLELFDVSDADRRARLQALAESIDAVRSRFGQDAIGFGPQKRTEPDE